MCEISVIVPIYNVEAYLRKCIESIIHQTFTDIEIFLVNDGSTDHSLEICREYEKLDSRIIVIDKPNGGLSDARNAGMERASGRYLYFIDGDDYVHNALLGIFHEQAETHQSDIVMCELRYTPESESITDIVLGKDEINKAVTVQDTESAFKEIFGERRIQYILTNNKLYSKRLFEGIRYPVGKIHEDEFITYKLIYEANKVVCLSLPLYYYVQRENSIMSTGFSEKRFHRVMAFEERKDFCIKNKICIEEAVRWYLNFYKDFICQYEKEYPTEKNKIVEYKRNYREKYKLSMKYLSGATRFHFIISQKMPVIYKEVRRLMKKEKSVC